MQQPYQTNNAALAVTLATCGVPFEVDPNTGRAMPFLNYYSYEKLVQLGYKGSGLSIDDAVRDAWQKGKRGDLVFCFQAVDPLPEILAAFDAQALAIKDADTSAGRVGFQEIERLDIPPEAAAKLCCQFAKNRTAMLDVGWRTAIPWIQISGPVQEVTEGGKAYRVGSFKLYRLGASAETKAKIGL